MNDLIINVSFRGDYSFLKWVIKKYKSELPYNGEVIQFTKSLPVIANSTGFNWIKYGVPSRTWNSLHKDLVIARLMGKIKDEDVRTLEELKKEYDSLKTI